MACDTPQNKKKNIQITELRASSHSEKYLLLNIETVFLETKKKKIADEP